MSARDAHGLACICDICSPLSAAAHSPSMKSAPSAAARFDSAQVGQLFERLSPYGQAVVWASLTAAARLDGVRG